MHQARRTSLGWINGKLHDFSPWMSSARASNEDRWRLQVTCSGSGCLQDCMCIWQGDRCISAHRCHSDSGLDDHHNYSQNWITIARAMGVRNRYVQTSMSSSLMTCHHLPWCRILPLNPRGTPCCHDRRVALFLSTHLQGTTTEPNWLGVCRRACLSKNGVDSQ